MCSSIFLAFSGGTQAGIHAAVPPAAEAGPTDTAASEGAGQGEKETADGEKEKHVEHDDGAEPQ